jgi:hypothetical protein
LSASGGLYLIFSRFTALFITILAFRVLIYFLHGFAVLLGGSASGLPCCPVYSFGLFWSFFSGFIGCFACFDSLVDNPEHVDPLVPEKNRVK